MWRQRAKQRLEAEEEEMSEFLDKTGADCEQERPRFKDKMQQNKILDAVFNPRVRLHRLVFPADVQQMVLIKEEAPEEWRPGVDQKDPETLNIKEEEEELWTSLEEEQLSVKEETDDPRFPFTAVPLKSEDDEENLLFSQLHQHQVEDGDLPTCSSAEQMKAPTGGEDCGGAEISGLVEKTAADYEEEQKNKILDAVFNPKVHLHRLVFPADVQQKVLIEEEAPEECRPGVDQEDPEPLHIKLHGHQVEDRDLPTCSSAEQMKGTTGGEDCGGAEPTRNPDLNTDEDDSSSAETEVSEADEDDENVNDPDSQLKGFSDSGSEPEDSDKDWKESRAPESGVNTVNKPYSCSECGKQFVHKLSLQRHLTCHSRKMSSTNLDHKKSFRGKKTGGPSKKTQSEQESFSCDDCGKRFHKKSYLNKHMRVHTGQKPFACDLCGQRFGLKSNLKQHMIVHTGQKPFACDLCGHRFGKKSHLKKHLRVHTGQKPFACDLCGQRFGHKSSLNTHMIVHTGQKPFACDLCGQRFGHKSSLNIHMIVHTGQKPFACDVCGQRSRSKSNLNEHMIVHTGQKPVACDVCGKRFGRKSLLNTHMIVHTGQKPFVCDVCGQRFGHKSSLNRHMIVHTGQKPFACDVCGQRFGQKWHFNRHLSVHTGSENISPVNIKTAPKDI